MGDRKWERAFADHHEALDRYAAAVTALDEDAWLREWAPGKWSPAAITQHVTLVYQVGAQALRGEIQMRYRVGPGWRTLLRWFLLPHMLFHRSLPVKAKAPREVRPEGDLPGRSEAIEKLRASALEAEQVLRGTIGRRDVRVAHPYFGELSPLRFLRFSAVHTDHHRKQLEAAGTTGRYDAPLK